VLSAFKGSQACFLRFVELHFPSGHELSQHLSHVLLSAVVHFRVPIVIALPDKFHVDASKSSAQLFFAKGGRPVVFAVPTPKFLQKTHAQTLKNQPTRGSALKPLLMPAVNIS
jgi:hypothetical protein